MKPLLVLALLTLAPQEKNEAERLFLEMEEKLSKAKTFEVVTWGSAESTGEMVSLRASIAVAKENRLRLSSTLVQPMEGRNLLAVCNGWELATQKRGERRSKPVPKSLAADFVRGLSRAGALFSCGWLDAMTSSGEAMSARRRVPQASSFAFGKVKKDVWGVVVEYRLRGLEGLDSVSVTVWLDPETRLPRRRELRHLDKNATLAYVEEYSDWKLDGTIDAATIKLPKDD